MCQIDQVDGSNAGPLAQRWPLLLLTLVGGFAGAGLGLLVGVAVDPPRGALARWVVSSVLLLLGVYEVTGRRAPLTFVGRETPRIWAERHPVPWAILTGATLGTGFFTRIGVALWYLVPLSALLVGSPRDVAVVFAVYATVRNALIIPVSLAYDRRDAVSVGTWLTGRMSMARRISGYSCLAVAGAVAVGLL